MQEFKKNLWIDQLYAIYPNEFSNAEHRLSNISSIQPVSCSYGPDVSLRFSLNNALILSHPGKGHMSGLRHELSACAGVGIVLETLIFMCYFSPDFKQNWLALMSLNIGGINIWNTADISIKFIVWASK